MPPDNSTGLKEDVYSFIKNFHAHIKSNNLTDVENDYQVKFPKLTEQYFSNTKWPSSDVVIQVVGEDKLFVLLYNELYYRHIYARVNSNLSVEEMNLSYLNYIALFDELVHSTHPLRLNLPNQWLWDIIDEFLYQFHKFKAFRMRVKHKPEDEAALKQNGRIWSIHCVLNVLYSLVEKSAINEQLSYYARQGDPDEIADEFGRSPLYKMLGFFSLIGLCRIHCLMADYNSAIKALENIKFSRLEMYHDVFTCHIATGYYLGLSFMMMRRYLDAIQTFSATLAYKARGICVSIGQRSDLREYVNKQADQMSCLLALCSTFCPVSSIDHPINLETDRRDKFSETLHQLQQLDETDFALTFDFGCPKFISVEQQSDAAQPSTTTRSNQQLTSDIESAATEPQRQQSELFKAECHQQIDLLRLRSFLKLYTSIPIAKLALHLNCSETDLNVSLMAYKYRMKQVTGVQPTIGSTDKTSSSFYPDLDFYIDKGVVHIADTTVDRRFSEYFVRHIDMLQQMNTTLDGLERRLHDKSVQGTTTA